MAGLKRSRPGAATFPTGSGLPGFKVFKTGVNVQLDFVGYDSKIPTIGHVVPAITAMDEDGKKIPKQFMPQRDGLGKNGLTPFYVMAEVAHGVGIGEHRRTFISCDVYDDTTDRAELPYNVLYRRISQAIKLASGKADSWRVDCRIKKVNPKMWMDLMPGSAQNWKDQAFIKPRGMRTVFINWLPLYAGDRFSVSNDNFLRGSGPNDIPHILMLRSSAADAFIKEINLELPAVDISGVDGSKFTDAYVHGDFVALDGTGKFLIVYHPTNHSDVPHLLGRAQSKQTDGAVIELDTAPVASNVGGEQEFGVAPYKVDFSAKVIVKNPRNPNVGEVAITNRKFIGRPEVAKNVLANYYDLWDCFEVMEPAQQVLELALAFKPKPEIIWYAFQADHSEWLTDEVKAVLQAQTQVAVKGAMQDDEAQDDTIESEYLQVEDEVNVDDEFSSMFEAVDDGEEEVKWENKSGKVDETTEELQSLNDDMDELLSRTAVKEAKEVKANKAARASATVAAATAKKLLQKSKNIKSKKDTSTADTATPKKRHQKPTDGLPEA